MTRIALFLGVLLLCWSGAAGAQVHGRVLDEAGRPLPAASVELWTSSRRLARTAADAEGRFTFAAGVAAGATSAAAYRIGYQSATVPLRGDASLEIRLVPAPLALGGLRVRAPERRLCPNREDPRARGQWERARRLYASPAMWDVTLRSDRYEADVPRGAIGVVDGLRADSGGFTSGDLSRVRADADGTLAGVYARRTEFDQGQHWEYAPLAWGLNPHFVTPRFGEAHRLAIVSERAGLVVLGFCPARRDAPGIEGTLSLTADGTLRSARWRHRVPGSRREAGGEVDYLPPAAATRNLLLARRSLFWRSWRGAFHFREDRYSEWVVAQRVQADGR